MTPEQLSKAKQIIKRADEIQSLLNEIRENGPYETSSWKNAGTMMSKTLISDIVSAGREVVRIRLEAELESLVFPQGGRSDEQVPDSGEPTAGPNRG